VALGASVMDSALLERMGVMVEAESASANWPAARRENFIDIGLCSGCSGQTRARIDRVAVGVTEHHQAVSSERTGKRNDVTSFPAKQVQHRANVVRVLDEIDK
jgi:hypothetical protein